MPNFSQMTTLFARITLVGILCVAGYIALQPSYNMAHWTPNTQMRSLGFSYETVLAYERHFHMFMHLFIGFLVTVLLYYSRIYYPNQDRTRILCGFVIMLFLILLLESVQSRIGRDVESVDIVLGIAGTLAASIMLFVLLKISQEKT